MRALLATFLVLAGCHNVGGIQPLDTADLNEGDTDTDTDADTDTDTDTDADTDADTDVFQPGQYVGTVDATMEQWETYTCSGDVELDVGSDGSVTGFAICNWSSYHGLEGEISGAVGQTDFTGIWSIQMGGWEDWELALTGSVSAGTFTATFHDESDWSTTDGSIEAYLLD